MLVWAQNQHKIQKTFFGNKFEHSEDGDFFGENFDILNNNYDSLYDNKKKTKDNNQVENDEVFLN